MPFAPKSPLPKFPTSPVPKVPPGLPVPKSVPPPSLPAPTGGPSFNPLLPKVPTGDIGGTADIEQAISAATLGIANQPVVIPPPATTINVNQVATVFTTFATANGLAAGFGAVGDVVINAAGARLNSAAWSAGDTSIINTEIFTQSAQSQSSGDYYLDIFRADPDADVDQEPQFAVSYGDFFGSGSTNLEGQSEGKTKTAAMYKQIAALVEDKGDSDFRFTINNQNADRIIVYSLYRNRMRERIDAGNWELKVNHNGTLRQYVDEKVSTPAADLGDGPFSIFSGSIDDGANNTTEVGKVYPNYGLLVFTASFGALNVPVDESNLSYDGGGGSAADTSGRNYNVHLGYNLLTGSNAYFQARAQENVHSRTYFCRIPNYKYNYSSNPTFTTGSTGQLRHSTMVGDPSVYITTVGLYSAQNELMAVAKLSKPLLKSFEREALIRVRLEY